MRPPAWPYLLLSCLLLTFFFPLPATAQEDDPPHTVLLPSVARNWPPVWKWTDPVLVNGIEAHLSPVQAIFDHRGRLHLFWDSWSSSVPQLIYHATEDKAGWLAARPVAMTLGVSTLSGPPVVDDAGAIHLVWRNKLVSDKGTVYRVMYARFSNDLWDAEEEIYRSDRELESILQANSDGSLSIYVYDYQQDDQLHVGHLTVDGWQISTAIKLPEHADQYWADQQYGLRFYGSTSDHGTYYSYWQSGDFLAYELLIDGFTVRSRNSVLDAQLNLHTVWRDYAPVPGGNVYGLYHGCFDTSLVPHVPEVTSGNVAVSKYVLSTAGSIWFALAWQSSSGVILGLWDNCRRMTSSPVPVEDLYLKTLSAVAVDVDRMRACTIVRRYLSEIYEVHCAYLVPQD